MAKGSSQEKVIDDDETFVPQERLEAILIFLAHAADQDFKVFQMDVKSALEIEKFKRKCMLSNQQASLILIFLTMYIKFTKPFKDLKKHIKLDIKH